MNLSKKKKLIARTLGIGVGRVYLDSERTKDIKEAITRQDVRDLIKEGVVKIKEARGKRKKIKTKAKRGKGKVKKKINKRKQDYVRLTRKLRGYVKGLKEKNKITREEYYELRKKIKAKAFKSLAHMSEFVK